MSQIEGQKEEECVSKTGHGAENPEDRANRYDTRQDDSEAGEKIRAPAGQEGFFHVRSLEPSDSLLKGNSRVTLFNRRFSSSFILRRAAGVVSSKPLKCRKP